MAIIGVRNCKFNGSSCGKVANVSVSYNFKQYSRLNQNQYRYDSATVSIVSAGGFASDIFNVSGTLTWDTVEMIDGVKKVFSNTLYNVVLQEPNLSAVTKAESVSFTTYSITGNCHYLPYGVLRWENVTPSTSALRTRLESYLTENGLWDHYIITTHSDAMNLAVQFRNSFNPQLSEPVYIWDNDAKKAIVISLVQGKRTALAFDGSDPDFTAQAHASSSLGTLVKSWNMGYSTSFLGTLSINLFDTSNLLVTGWSYDSTKFEYSGQWSALKNRYWENGEYPYGMPLSTTPNEGDMLWIRARYRIFDSNYQQRAFIGFDKRSGMLWPSRFPANYFTFRGNNQAQYTVVEGFATFANGIFPMCEQSSPFYFYNSDAYHNDALEIYRFYAEEIV